MKQAVFYCRVDAPINEFTQTAISAQEDKLRNYAYKNGINIKKCYTDAGRSAIDTERPGIQELIYDMQSEPVDFVIVVNRSRLYLGAVPTVLKSLSNKIISLSEIALKEI